MSVPIQQQQQQPQQPGQYPEAPPPPPPHARDVSMTPSPPPPPKKKKGKIAKHNFLLAAFHFLSAYLLIGVVALGFLAFKIGALKDVQVDPDLQRIPNSTRSL